MAKVDLKKLSLKELKALEKNVQAAIAAAEQSSKAEALKAMEATAQKHGFKLKELVGGKAAKAKAPRPAKYKHPENPALTWSGRGRQPAWIKDGLKRGKALKDFAI